MRTNNILNIDFFGLRNPTPAQRHVLGLNEDDELEDDELLAPPPLPVMEEVQAYVEAQDWSVYKVMRSRYDGKCRDTGRPFEQGDWILWNSDNKTVYRPGSETFSQYINFLREVI